MKIQNQPLEENVPEVAMSDLSEIFMDLQDKHRNVFIHQMENQVFFYRSLGRSEYRKILTDPDFDDYAKEEIICQVCTLWPLNYDFEECDAGIPSVLTEKILKNSFLDNVQSRKSVLNYYREEMFDLDNQITCVINEAFPQFDIEEIEKWDIEKTTKYLSRAEWKLHNLRGLAFVDSTDREESFYQRTEQPPQQEESKARQQPVTEEVAKPAENKTMRGGDKKEKLTPEKIRELQAKYPEINWAGDTILNEGISGMEDSVDVVSPALRPGF